ncbi:metal ABC transporter solute-binding protein, Zn/Mn family [Bifidobacterium aerophilum]|uniref:ABC transporter substrate-binding protein n=1 Tax=Bifidobacterium aerophilum TaxID=1798155 RepID=A0A6N9Z4J0_9BIFI|nr:zinc ABC transporter substrate-binding protein [Bifidobacterium aerophilum]NEG89366.1 ABC transporter substrate-binding protein [Bifidobacterium aerophilum]
MSIRFSHMAKIVAAAVAASLLAVAGGCGAVSEPQAQPETPSQKPAGPIEVVASINQWGSLAKQIGGDDVNVTSILSSTSVDAHDFEPKTSDVAKLSKAQVVVVNGAGYDSWASKSLGKDTTSVSAAQIVGAMEGDNPHLWFSKDARNGMAKELVDTFSKALPDKKSAFMKRYKQWQSQEKTVERKMDEFSSAHKDVTYAATEAVAYYLMSDMGFEDKTPEGYAASASAEGEAAPADLQEFQKLIESKGIDLLVNNTQEASDATNMITSTAGKSDVPVFDVSEQMPEDQDDLTTWIGSLVDTVTGYFDVCETDDADGTDGGNDDSDDAQKDDEADGKADDDNADSNDVKSCKAPEDDSDTSDAGSSSDDATNGSGSASGTKDDDRSKSDE